MFTGLFLLIFIILIVVAFLFKNAAIDMYKAFGLDTLNDMTPAHVRSIPDNKRQSAITRIKKALRSNIKTIAENACRNTYNRTLKKARESLKNIFILEHEFNDIPADKNYESSVNEELLTVIDRSECGMSLKDMEVMQDYMKHVKFWSGVKTGAGDITSICAVDATTRNAIGNSMFLHLVNCDLRDIYLQTKRIYNLEPNGPIGVDAELMNLQSYANGTSKKQKSLKYLFLLAEICQKVISTHPEIKNDYKEFLTHFYPLVNYKFKWEAPRYGDPMPGHVEKTLLKERFRPIQSPELGDNGNTEVEKELDNLVKQLKSPPDTVNTDRETLKPYIVERMKTSQMIEDNYLMSVEESKTIMNYIEEIDKNDIVDLLYIEDCVHSNPRVMKSQSASDRLTFSNNYNPPIANVFNAFKVAYSVVIHKEPLVDIDTIIKYASDVRMFNETAERECNPKRKMLKFIDILKELVADSTVGTRQIKATTIKQFLLGTNMNQKTLEAKTTISKKSDGALLPVDEINVESTEGFAENGYLLIKSGKITQTRISYNGITNSSFLECGGGNGKLETGRQVTQTILTPVQKAALNMESSIGSHVYYNNTKWLEVYRDILARLPEHARKFSCNIDDSNKTLKNIIIGMQVYKDAKSYVSEKQVIDFPDLKEYIDKGIVKPVSIKDTAYKKEQKDLYESRKNNPEKQIDILAKLSKDKWMELVKQYNIELKKRDNDLKNADFSEINSAKIYLDQRSIGRLAPYINDFVRSSLVFMYEDVSQNELKKQIKNLITSSRDPNGYGVVDLTKFGDANQKIPKTFNPASLTAGVGKSLEAMVKNLDGKFISSLIADVSRKAIRLAPKHDNEAWAAMVDGLKIIRTKKDFAGEVKKMMNNPLDEWMDNRPIPLKTVWGEDANIDPTLVVVNNNPQGNGAPPPAPPPPPAPKIIVGSGGGPPPPPPPQPGFVNIMGNISLNLPILEDRLDKDKGSVIANDEYYWVDVVGYIPPYEQRDDAVVHPVVTAQSAAAGQPVLDAATEAQINNLQRQLDDANKNEADKKIELENTIKKLNDMVAANKKREKDLSDQAVNIVNHINNNNNEIQTLRKAAIINSTKIAELQQEIVDKEAELVAKNAEIKNHKLKMIAVIAAAGTIGALLGAYSSPGAVVSTGISLAATLGTAAASAATGVGVGLVLKPVITPKPPPVVNAPLAPPKIIYNTADADEGDVKELLKNMVKKNPKNVIDLVYKTIIPYKERKAKSTLDKIQKIKQVMQS